MWIRSQDKKLLINAKNFFIQFMGETRIKITNGWDVLATYSSEEKAMKVMDMIEDAILECECMRTGHAEYDFGAFVFDMPEDSEVEV